MARNCFPFFVVALCFCSVSAVFLPTTTLPLTSAGGSTGFAVGGNELNVAVNFRITIVDTLIASMKDLFKSFNGWLQSVASDVGVQSRDGYAQFVNSMTGAFSALQNQTFDTQEQLLSALDEAIPKMEDALKAGYQLLGSLCAQQQALGIVALKALITKLEAAIALAQSARLKILYNCATGKISSTSQPSGSCNVTAVSIFNGSNPLNVTVPLDSAPVNDAVDQANSLYGSSNTFIAQNADNAALQANVNYINLVNGLNSAFDGLQDQTISTAEQASAAMLQLRSGLQAALTSAQALTASLASQGQTQASNQAQALASQIQTTLDAANEASTSLASSGGVDVGGNGSVSTSATVTIG